MSGKGIGYGFNEAQSPDIQKGLDKDKITELSKFYTSCDYCTKKRL